MGCLPVYFLCLLCLILCLDSFKNVVWLVGWLGIMKGTNYSGTISVWLVPMLQSQGRWCGLARSLGVTSLNSHFSTKLKKRNYFLVTWLAPKKGWNASRKIIEDSIQTPNWTTEFWWWIYPCRLPTIDFAAHTCQHCDPCCDCECCLISIASESCSCINYDLQGGTNWTIYLPATRPSKKGGSQARASSTLILFKCVWFCFITNLAPPLKHHMVSYGSCGTQCLIFGYIHE